jgi:hypothetical protein
VKAFKQPHFFLILGSVNIGEATHRELTDKSRTKKEMKKMERLKEKIEEIIQAYEANEEFTLQHFYVAIKAVNFQA